MSCRLPGGIESPEQLWEALLRGDDLVKEVPAERWDMEQYYDPEPGVPGRSISKWAAFLDDPVGFDADFFGIGDREALASDPQHRVLLETAWEALEHAGLPPTQIVDSLTGVFVGLTHSDYSYLAADAAALEGPYGFSGTNFSLGSGRISYALGVHGPAVTVDTACSSGLLAVHLACRSLHNGESNLAVAAGASVSLEPRKFAAGSAEGMLSPTGRCHAFDAAADGFAVSEGSVVLLLKRLSDAVADNDRILAVLRGTAANQDGKTVNISVPSMTAQTAVYRSALAAAGVDAATVGMVEAHGPGTPIGDPIEYESLANVYGITGPTALASVKTNFGHAQSASGPLGLMKAILALQHGVVPQNLHFERLPDALAEIKTKLFVPQSVTPWPTNGAHPRRASVSSYGFSGTNVHAILEQAPVNAPGDDPSASAIDGPLLYPLSATSADALRRTAARLADWVDTHADEISGADLGYTLARRRGHRPVRVSVTASSLPELTASLREIAGDEVPYQPAAGRDDRGPVWLFSGQGSQWAAMGAELLRTEPVFAAAIAEVEPLIAAESGFSVTEAISATDTVTGIDRVQPTIFAMQVALAATMKSYGVVPGAVIGHSMGEAAAAVVAGALSLHDGVRVICRRSRLMLRVSGAGAMASVELPAQQVLSELMARGIKDVVVAVVASPKSTVIGGATESVRQLVAGWEEREIMAREVAVDVASHSPQVDPILDELAEILPELEPREPAIPYYSATHFDPRDLPTCDADYWVENLRYTVRFASAVQAALEDGFRVFAEMAPHPLLTHAVDQTAGGLDMRVEALACMRREQELPHGLRGVLGDLHNAGAAVDFSVMYPGGQLVDAPLPTWTHRQFVYELDSKDLRARGVNSVAVHPLLGAHVRLLEEPERHAWEAEVGTTALPWLGDHKIHDIAVLPGAAYLEMALAASRAIHGETAAIRDVRFEQMLLLEATTPVAANATVHSPGVVKFAVEAEQEGERARRASAVLYPAADDAEAPAHDIDTLLAEHPHRVEGDELRRGFDKRGLQYGPAFGGLAAVLTAETGGDTVLAEVGLPPSIRSQQSDYGLHPALLDACFQSVAAHPAIHAAGIGGLMLPLGVRRLQTYGAARDIRYAYSRVTSADPTWVEADLELLDEHGAVVAIVEGLQIGSGSSESANRQRLLNERLLTIEWQKRDVPESTDSEAGNWLLVSTSAGADVVANTLTDALKVARAQATSVVWPHDADHEARAEELADHLRAGSFTAMVVLNGPKNGNPDDESAPRGGDYVHHLVRVIRGLSNNEGAPPRLFVVTRGAQTVLTDDRANLEQAGLRGLLRSVGNEYPDWRVTQIDVDERTDGECLARQLISGSEEDESAWRDGEWYTARLFPGPLRAEERFTALADGKQDGMRLQIRTPGDLQTIELTAFDRVPPEANEIEVAVTSSSINFADVLVTFGRYPSFEGRLPQLGTDFAGVVTAVGSDVTTHQVGDRVGGISPNGCWGTFVTCDADLAATLPAGLTEQQAAAVTTAHATAWYGLNDLARIDRRDKVLIHSATGGVGQAAIAIARAAGAEIFATAGSEQRRQLLRDWGIEHVYDSRSVEFAEQIKQDTGGYGVDIVLNSVTGAAQRAGIELLALGGRFIEIGKRDIYGDSRLGLFPFRRNLAFHGVDLGLMSHSHPERFHDLLDTVYRLTADGVLPMPESTHYPLTEAATAIRAMSAAEHTGKLVLDVPRTEPSRVAVPPGMIRVFRADGSYIITGGLGGLGLFLAEKLAAAGCGRIVLSSRSQPSEEALATIELIRAGGADIVVECGDIADRATADRLVAAATVTGLPLRGVLHGAAVVEDATLANITDGLIDRDWRPKAHGAWNLHEATLGAPLDWFCCFSSAASLIGSPGQGAYAAANSWLDAFTHWRKSQGLPATSIAWGAWGQVGRATALAEDTDTAIAPDEGAYAFESMLRHDRAYAGYAPLIGTPWLTTFAQRSKFAEMFKSAGAGAKGSSKLRAELNELPVEEWAGRVRKLLSEQIGLLLRRSVDPDRPLSEYGLDSLGTLELRTRVESETGVRISAQNIIDHGTVRALSQFLADELAASQTVSAAAGGE
ncbi:sulfolipid-1 biosynthesis phthioceranic/hydroxyphthioceranic acid synthase [Candidatus Mycobacterium wuenschmannii]|uniref:Phthioceranic/hydroxyphthioceranic acid synthase n=1 Tax=Candidatus Mycobacterium wuenschmannii TaxID=3027808 RepID=A0ABY8W0G6_9MYCO|nr:sulfolipid-1 biosynthesis phthioceranic/hydroxyphthioceranic acid synthase [Candidatus Mycobacterium wuenschmannii]WIM88720.1 sulfolipid-1 biosynthesis phthioceranic/hydroxyphthioceranic acid synthase [Candidatus Mycobacterium wuenschmannii]